MNDDTRRVALDGVDEMETGDESAIDEHAMEEAADLEARLVTLAGRVVELESELGAARATLETSDRERALDAAVAGSGAVDPETVRVLVARALEGAPETSAAEQVALLRDRKPVLFREARSAGSVMAATAASRGSSAGLVAARRAAAEGDRASLLRYLRLRREGS